MHGINPLSKGDLNASAVQKVSCQNNSESDQSTQLQSLLQNDTVTVVTCPFECGIKVDITGLKQHIIDKHSSSRETETRNYPLKPSEVLPCEKNEDLNASAVQKVSCQHNSESDQSTQLQSLLQNDTVTVLTCPFKCNIKMDLMGLKQHILDNHSSSREQNRTLILPKGQTTFLVKNWMYLKSFQVNNVLIPFLFLALLSVALK